MAVSIVDTALGGSGDSSGDITPSGSDRLIVCGVLGDQTADIGCTAVNFNTSEALTDVTQSHTTGTGQYQEFWYRIAPSATTAACVASGGVGEWILPALAVSGAHQTTPVPTGDIQISESGGATTATGKGAYITGSEEIGLQASPSL